MCGSPGNGHVTSSNPSTECSLHHFHINMLQQCIYFWKDHRWTKKGMGLAIFKSVFKRFIETTWTSSLTLLVQFRKDGDCYLTMKTRRSCQKCRYDRCKAAGMDASAVLNEQQRQIRFRRVIERKNREQNRRESGAGSQSSPEPSRSNLFPPLPVLQPPNRWKDEPSSSLVQERWTNGLALRTDKNVWHVAIHELPKILDL